MGARGETDRVVRAVVGTVLAVCVVMTVVWWRKRAEDRAAVRGAMPGCIARLGSEAECDARFDKHHRECFTYNNKPAGKFSPRAFDEKGYLECVIASPEPWAAARRAARTEREKAERRQLR